MFRPVVTIDSRDAISNTTDGAVNIPSLAVEFLGQNALSVLFCAIETGAIIVLVARFFARKRERWAIQLLVYFVTLVAMFQMAATFASMWRASVQEFGNWTAVSNFQWPDKIRFGLSSFIAAPVQLYYIWRCWHVSLHRRPYIAVFLVLLVIGSIATQIYVIVLMFLVNWNSGASHLVGMNAYYACSMLSLAFSVVIDFSVTAILLVFLIRSRSDMHTRQIRHILFRLTLITWESAVPPCTCAIVALVLGAVSAPVISNWGIMLQTVLGMLYLISLLMTLEGRAMLAGATSGARQFPTLTVASQNVAAAWSATPGDTDASKDFPKSPLEFNVLSSDTGAEGLGSSTFDSVSTKPGSV